MAQSQQELLTAIHAAEAELRLMAGYEESYPEFYDQLNRNLTALMREYAQAMGEDAPYATRETAPEQSAQQPPAQQPPKPAPGNQQTPPKPQTPTKPKTTTQHHVATQEVLRLAGRGDALMLLHWQDEDAGQGSGNNGSPKPKPKPQPAPQPKPQPKTEPKPGESAPNPGTSSGSSGDPKPKGEAPPPSPPPEETEPTGPPKPQSLKIVKVTADKYKDGYNNFQLRSDVAELYDKVRAEATKRGGVITSSGGIRALTATVGASRSATSFHYSGRALDMYIYSGMVDPAKDPFVVVREEARVYRVYARCNAADAEVSELKNVMSYFKRNGSLTASGSFFDLTALFKQHGFERIKARESFESGGDQLGAEWWHFQCERGLVSGKSTFGEELFGDLFRSHAATHTAVGISQLRVRRELEVK